MANNFKKLPSVLFGQNITVVGYVSKSPSANDSNDGLSPDTPKISFSTNQASTDYLQVGAGLYNNLPPSSQRQQLVGDGKCVFKDINLTGSNQGRKKFINIDFINYSETAGNAANRDFFGCKIKNYLVTNPDSFSSVTLDSCIIINGNSLLDTVTRNTIVINTSLQVSIVDHVNNYYDTSSEILIDQSSNKFVENSNVNCVIKFNINSSLKSYAIQDELTGTPQDNGYALGVEWLSEAQLTSDGYTGNITGWDAAIATCINRDPKFNNVSLEDFTLQADSPHIAAADDGSNIGGTQVALSTTVSDDGVGTVEVIPSPEIDTTITDSWKLNAGETEGFIDIIQRVSSESVVLGIINPLSVLNFDSDFAGGSPENNNVPDSEPLTADYPRKLTTTSLAPDTTTVNVTGHDVQVGELVRIAGEDREVTAVATDSFTVNSAFRAAVANGITFQVGTENQLAALRPNRLTYLLRTSNQTAKPTVDSEWDNDVAPVYGVAGDFLTQEWFNEPGYVIDGTNNVFGLGDSERNPALSTNQIACKWIQIRVYIRNNYES